MKEWAAARQRVQDMKSTDQKAAEKLNKEITIRYGWKKYSWCNDLIYVTNILRVTDMGNLGKNKIRLLTEIGFQIRRKITQKLRLFRENILGKTFLKNQSPAEQSFR